MGLGSTASTVGFGAFGLIFGGLVGGVLQHFLNPCNVRNFPDFAGAISEADCVSWLSAEGDLGANFIAFVTVTIRIEASLLLALAIGAFYQLTLPYAERKGAAFIYGTVSILACLVDLDHAGILTYGSNQLMTPMMSAASVPLIGLWTFLGSCFWLSWLLTGSEDAKQKAN